MASEDAAWVANVVENVEKQPEVQPKGRHEEKQATTAALLLLLGRTTKLERAMGDESVALEKQDERGQNLEEEHSDNGALLENATQEIKDLKWSMDQYFLISSTISVGLELCCGSMLQDVSLDWWRRLGGMTVNTREEFQWEFQKLSKWRRVQVVASAMSSVEGLRDCSRDESYSGHEKPEASEGNSGGESRRNESKSGSKENRDRDKLELERRGVREVASAMSIVEGLDDYSRDDGYSDHGELKGSKARGGGEHRSDESKS